MRRRASKRSRKISFGGAKPQLISPGLVGEPGFFVPFPDCVCSGLSLALMVFKSICIGSGQASYRLAGTGGMRSDTPGGCAGTMAGLDDPFRRQLPQDP